VLDQIEDLTYRRTKRIVEVIESRIKDEEYISRLHIGINATATGNFILAKLNSQDLSLEDLIGKAPGDDRVQMQNTEATSADVQKIEEWKSAAEAKGLKLP
jgi:hypothetical protein